MLAHPASALATDVGSATKSYRTPQADGFAADGDDVAAAPAREAELLEVARAAEARGVTPICAQLGHNIGSVVQQLGATHDSVLDDVVSSCVLGG